MSFRVPTLYESEGPTAFHEVHSFEDWYLPLIVFGHLHLRMDNGHLKEQFWGGQDVILSGNRWKENSLVCVVLFYSYFLQHWGLCYFIVSALLSLILLYIWNKWRWSGCGDDLEPLTCWITTRISAQTIAFVSYNRWHRWTIKTYCSSVFYLCR